MRDDDKLRVPDPDATDGDDSPYDAAIVVGATLSILFGLAIFLIQLESTGHQPGAPTEASQTGQSNGPMDRLRRLARQKSGAELETREWTPDETVLAFSKGPRAVARAICRASTDALSSGSLPAEAAAELAAAVDRRAPHVPWQCLMDGYLQDQISSELAVYDKLDTFWDEMRAFRASGDVVEQILAGWRAEVRRAPGPEARGLPDSERFDRWIRLCALNFDFPAGEACRRLLADLAPRHGADLLGVVETHLQESTPNPNYDLPILIDGLERLASVGQPPDWRIVETEELPDYDVDLRIGATFYLCRILNSPNDDVGERAARALSEAAGVSPRAVDDGLRRRWLQACELAFQSDGENAESLAVWNGDNNSAPRYELQHAIERGHCEVRDDHPDWYCASLKWQGGQPEDLRDFFVETRHLDWD